MALQLQQSMGRSPVASEPSLRPGSLAPACPRSVLLFFQAFLFVHPLLKGNFLMLLCIMACYLLIVFTALVTN